MIEPNFNIFLWIFFISTCLKSLAVILAGAMHAERDTHYDGYDIVSGIIVLMLMAWVVIA